MGNIKPKELSKLGYTDNVARSLAIELVSKYCKHNSQEEIVNKLREIIQSPEIFKQDVVWGRLAEMISPTRIYLVKTISTNWRYHKWKWP